MRYGILSDVHGNLPALETVLEALGRLDVDAYACAGDLVGYGPQPNECVEAVRELGAACVAGNHDLIVLGKLSDDRCERIARESLRWTRAVLDDSTRAYLSTLPIQLELPGGVVVTHGSLNSPQEYVLDVQQAGSQLSRLAREFPSAGVLVVGHTHRAFVSDGKVAIPTRADEPLEVDATKRWLLNPGAVGQSRERLIRARFMVLDLDRREATLYALRYDVRSTRVLLRQKGLSGRTVHLPPWRLKALLRPAIRAVRARRPERR